MNYIPINYYTISLLIGAFTALMSGIVVLIHNNHRSENQAWFALTISTAIWSLGYFFMTVSQTHEAGLISNWILHYAAIFIPLFYYLLVLIITGSFQKNKIQFIVFAVFAFIFTVINQLPIFVSDVVPKVGFNYAPVPGPLYIFFFLYFIGLVINGLITTFITIIRTNDKTVKVRLLYTIVFTIAAAVGGGSVFLTTFLITIPPYFLILFSIYPAISGYAILKHQLFDVKLILAQVIIFSLWIFIFIRIFLSESSRDQIVNAILLFITIILGLFLIRSVKKEISQREHIQHLADDLKKANTRLTELNRQKSEFVSFATHQLRAPLTAMKGYASLILDGDFGELSKEIKEAVFKIFESSKTLTNIVDDYLNISRIELGTMKYDFEILSLKELVESVIGELMPNIEKSHLAFVFNTNPSNADEKFMIHADKDKLKQVIMNLIDNSTKYTPSGSIEVSLVKNTKERKITLSVKDTGVGMASEVIPKLFSKFVRANNANRQNIYGTGLGLFIAKEIATAHNGRIWAESDGEGKGSTFFLELEGE